MAGRTLLYDALAQNDVDMQNHRLLNLDTSNLPPVGIPPTVHPPTNEWLHDWDSATQEWTSTQPTFPDIGGFLTGPQMQHIDQLGRVRVGIWQATPLTAIFVPPLDQIRPPTATVSMNGNRLINVGSPVDPNDAVTLGYMDFLLQGLVPKQAVRVATINSSHTMSGFGPIDGITLVDGDRILVKNRANQAQNGLYIAHSGPWTRSTDADTGDELERAYCAVLEGDINSGTSWVQVNTVDTINIDPVAFVLFSSTPSANIIAGNGLERVVNTLNVVGTSNRIDVGSAVDISPAYEGQSSITTLGVITDGTWNADILTSEFGGTGVDNGGQTLALVNASVSFQKISGLDANLAIMVPGGTTITTLSTGTMASLDGIQTLTNKRITRRVNTIASNAQPSINTDTTDTFYITFLATNITSMTANLTGTPTDGQELVIWIHDNGGLGGKTIAWNTTSDKFAASSDLPLPVLTTAGMWLFLRFSYNTQITRWVLTEKLDNIAP